MIKDTEIIKQATEMVSEYISKGWIFNPGPMSGSDGSIFRVHLVKGETTIQIKVEHDRDSIDDTKYSMVNIWHLTVREFGKGFYTNGWCLWDSEGNLLSDKVFYQISDEFSESKVFGTKEEVMAAREIRTSRRVRNRECYTKEVTSNNTRRVATEILRKRAGYKRINAGMIEKITKDENGSYRVYLGILPSKQADRMVKIG